MGIEKVKWSGARNIFNFGPVIYLLSLGSNMGQRSENISAARRRLEECCGIITQESSIYETAPWGFDAEMWFYNQVIELESEINPEEMLREILLIEEQQGRTRKSDGTYYSRSVDVDILLAGDSIMESEQLTIPHPQMHLRKFVLVPAVEIAGDRMHPVFQKSLQQLLEDCPDQEEVRKI